MKPVFLFVVFIAVLLSSCKKDKAPETPLYERIGGEPVVTAIIDQSITNIITDARINFFFAALANDQARAQRLRNNLIDQLGQLCEGGQQYTGRSMVAVHTGLNISNTQFDAFIEDFTRAINSQNIAIKEKNELVQLYRELQNEIVGR